MARDRRRPPRPSVSIALLLAAGCGGAGGGKLNLYNENELINLLRVVMEFRAFGTRGDWGLTLGDGACPVTTSEDSRTIHEGGCTTDEGVRFEGSLTFRVPEPSDTDLPSVVADSWSHASPESTDVPDQASKWVDGFAEQVVIPGFIGFAENYALEVELDNTSWRAVAPSGVVTDDFQFRREGQPATEGGEWHWYEGTLEVVGRGTLDAYVAALTTNVGSLGVILDGEAVFATEDVEAVVDFSEVDDRGCSPATVGSRTVPVCANR